jgi:TetR/AcrR family fatty acid metabolism transcriptional regulator
VSKGTISYHFNGKDELFAEVVGRVRTAAEEFMVPRLAEAPSFLAWLGTYVRTNLTFMGARRDMLTALVEVITHTPAPNPYLASHQQSLDDLEAVVRAGQDRGELGRFDPGVFAMAMRGAIDAVPARLAADPGLHLDMYGNELAMLFERAAEVRE